MKKDKELDKLITDEKKLKQFMIRLFESKLDRRGRGKSLPINLLAFHHLLEIAKFMANNEQAEEFIQYTKHTKAHKTKQGFIVEGVNIELRFKESPLVPRKAINLKKRKRSNGASDKGNK
jgi:hypothetical protein